MNEETPYDQYSNQNQGIDSHYLSQIDFSVAEIDWKSAEHCNGAVVKEDHNLSDYKKYS